MRGRLLTGTLALGLLALLWSGVLPQLAPGPFSAHMVVHMGVVAVVAPLLALALAGSRLDPVRGHPARLPALPLTAVEFMVVWGWHLPVLHHAARAGGMALLLEQGSFLLAGLAVWMSALGGDAAERAGRAAVGTVALLLTSMHMTLLGALLGLAPRPLYHAGAARAALRDQQVGGALMLGVGGVVYLVAGVALTAALLGGRRVRHPMEEAS